MYFWPLDMAATPGKHHLNLEAEILVPLSIAQHPY